VNVEELFDPVHTENKMFGMIRCLTLQAIMRRSCAEN